LISSMPCSWSTNPSGGARREALSCRRRKRRPSQIETTSKVDAWRFRERAHDAREACTLLLSRHMRAPTLFGVVALVTACSSTRAPPSREPAIRWASATEANLRIEGLADAACVTSSTSGVIEVSVVFGVDGAPRLVHVLGTDHPRDDELRCIGAFVAQRGFPQALYSEVTGVARWSVPARSPESVPAFWCDDAPTLRGRASITRSKNKPVEVRIDEPRELAPKIRQCLVRQILRGEPQNAWPVPLSYGLVYQLNPLKGS
jgi:hypothetical protein